MKRIRVFIWAAVLLALPALAQTNFAGRWEFRPQDSKNVGMMAQMKLIATVKQTPDELMVSNLSTMNGQEMTSEVHLDLTGKPISNKAPMEATAETVTHWDGKRLVTTWTSEGSVAGTKTVRTETRSVSEDGRTMTVESQRGQSPAIVMVFSRK